MVDNSYIMVLLNLTIENSKLKRDAIDLQKKVKINNSETQTTYGIVFVL